MHKVSCPCSRHVCAACMVRRFEINHAAKRAAFNTDGSRVISCSDFDPQVRDAQQRLQQQHGKTNASSCEAALERAHGNLGMPLLSQVSNAVELHFSLINAAPQRRSFIHVRFSFPLA